MDFKFDCHLHIASICKALWKELREARETLCLQGGDWRPERWEGHYTAYSFQKNIKCVQLTLEQHRFELHRSIYTRIFFSINTVL